MGRASSTKRRRLFDFELGDDLRVELLRFDESSARPTPAALSNRLDSGSRIFRFVDQPSYASDLLAGDLWITTLIACKSAEGSGRRDEGEGELVHRVNLISSERPGGKEAIEQSGVFKLAPGARNVVIRGGGTLVGTMDAFVLCFTELYAPDRMEGTFGDWCVQLYSPLDAFRLITQQLSRQYSVSRALLGHVHYLGRTVSDYERPHTHRALLKPPDGYVHQREIRMIWEVAQLHHPLRPFKLRVPAVAKHFSLKAGHL